MFTKFYGTEKAGSRRNSTIEVCCRSRKRSNVTIINIYCTTIGDVSFEPLRTIITKAIISKARRVLAFFRELQTQKVKTRSSVEESKMGIYIPENILQS